ncbi:MAG TPA: hypothetical protein VGM69_12910 [Chloroflexota bacterium]|jgi:hypothetical protein
MVGNLGRRAFFALAGALLAASLVSSAGAAGTDHNCNGVTISGLAQTIREQNAADHGFAGQVFSGLAQQQQRDEFAHSFTDPLANCGANP